MLIDMKLKPQPKAEEKTLLNAEADRPEYPYGLRITLDDESLTKLGMSELPTVDAEFTLEALTCVIGVSRNYTHDPGTQGRSLELQIKALQLTPAKEQSEASHAQQLYSNSGMNS